MICGIQVSSVKPLLRTQEEVSQAFRKFAQMGAKAMQVQWIDFSVPESFIAGELEKNGLYSVGTQDFFTVVQEKKEYFINLNKLCGSKSVCVSRIAPEYKSAQGLIDFCGVLNAFEKELKEEGLELCFHPTTPDYASIEGLCPVDTLMANTDLPLCLDLYHVHKVGIDMAELIYKYEGRICMVHFKDYTVLPDGSQMLVPAGQGVIDFLPAVKACLDTNVPYAFVEQESWERDPFDCLNEALIWLKNACESVK